MPPSKSATIIKNTGLLYFRMFLSMIVSLYTSRIVLNTLGVSDFGIYNVVGSLVTSFAFIHSAMSGAVQRFFAFEIGRNNYEKLNKLFNVAIVIHFGVALVIILLVESIGLYFLNNKMIIPADRMVAAHWVFQLSLLTCCITIVSLPFNAIIIAFEKMKAFAYISIVEVGLKLIIVFLLQISPYDKLKIYAILTCGVAILIRITYEFYCKRNFPSVNFQFLWDKIAFKELIGFSSWNLLGCLSGVLRVQGVNVLLNVFFGTIINAAQGIANQVTSAVSGFVTNFQTALNPPIVKYYASNNTEKFTNLVFQGAKFSYYVMFLISLPIILETGYVLKIWLKMTPDYAVLFCQLSLIFCLIDCLSGPLTVATMATGKQMLYQIIVSGSYLVILPMSYILLKLGFPPQTTLFVCIVIAILALFGKLFVLKKLINFSFIHFVNQVLVRVSIVTVVSIIVPYLILQKQSPSFIRFLCVTIFSMVSVVCSIYFLGLHKNEKIFLQGKIKQQITSLKKHM